MILTLTTSAEEITTNNLITNGNFETGNANGWTTNGDVEVLNDCCTLNNVASNYDLEFGDSGSIEQQFNLTSDTISQAMLDNGITLDSTVEVQNGECGVAGCWGGSGNADTFTITLKIKDSDGNVLATSTKIRTDVTGINGANFTDSLTYNGVDSNLGNLNIAGTDANAPANLGGANVDNIIVTMTYDDEVISNEIIEQIETVFEELQEEIFKKVEIKQEFKFEEEFKIVQAPPMEEEIEIKEFIEMITMPEKEPEIMEEMPKAVEEIIEEKPEEEMITEEIIKEAKEEMPEEIIEEEPEQITEETKEEEVIEEAPQEAKEEESKEEVKTKVASKKTKKPKIDKIMAKVDAQIKDSAKNLTIKNIIKLDAMQSDQASLTAYNNVEFYKPKDIYLNQIEIFDNRSIYAEIDLVKYTANDIMEVKIKKLNEIKSKKRRLLLELQELKNG
tara:strand:- start:1111 stop:2451 length:1341 start_codon:yes stop_codon:yes gene_type:complete